MAVEHYLVVRNLMYRSVYNHRLNVVCNWLLERLVRTARQLGPDQVWADAVMARWLWSRTISTFHFSPTMTSAPGITCSDGSRRRRLAG